MSTTLNTLSARHGRTARRTGRGHGSGRGKTAGRGTKGQRARKGGRRGMIRRSLKHAISHLPKQRGFTSLQPSFLAVRLSALEKIGATIDHITPAVLIANGFHVGAKRGIKIVGSGTLTKKLTVAAHAFSATAEQAIRQAGGTVVRLR